MEPTKIQSDRLTFDISDSVDRYGVMTVTADFLTKVAAYCENHGLEIESTGGNNDKGEFYVYLREHSGVAQLVE